MLKCLYLFKILILVYRTRIPFYNQAISPSLFTTIQASFSITSFRRPIFIMHQPPFPGFAPNKIQRRPIPKAYYHLSRHSVYIKRGDWGSNPTTFRIPLHLIIPISQCGHEKRSRERSRYEILPGWPFSRIYTEFNGGRVTDRKCRGVTFFFLLLLFGVEARSQGRGGCRKYVCPNAWDLFLYCSVFGLILRGF